MSQKRPQPDAFIAARVAKLRAAMVERKVPALLVTSFADVSYLTGFEGDDSFALVTPEQFVLVSDSRYEEQISRECPWVEAVIRRKGIILEVGKLLKRLRITRLGVQAESMTLRQHESLRGEFKGKTAPRIVPVADLVVALRHIKDEREIALTEQAIAIAEHGFETLKAHLKVGMTENEIASLLVHEMRKRGALNASFDTIVAAGANGSLPHYRPGAVALQNNMPLLIDWGARFAGYVSDLTRVVFFGRVPRVIEDIYGVVLEAQMAAIDAIKPGKTAREIDRVARGIIKKAGYGKQFGHGLGHGIGRDIHEAIALNATSKIKLEPGMIVTVEPGIYLPGVGGVRIEDDVLITATGCRVLSRLPKTLESARL